MKGAQFKGLKVQKVCITHLMHLAYSEGWFLWIKVVYFYDYLDYISTFPISILKEAFQEAFHVLRVI